MTDMTDTTDTDRRQTWERYAAIWKAEGATEKRALCDACLSPECVYTDPRTQARGVDELITYMVEFHGQVPGGHFVTTEFFTHHQRSLAKWNMVGADGEVLGDGVSYGEYDADGKLTAMTGFFAPPA